MASWQYGILALLCAACASGPAERSDTPDATSPCTGKPGRLRGKSTHTLSAGGLARSFVYYAPSGLDADTPAPVVIVAHGFGMDADQMFELTGYPALADRERFVLLFPNGQEPMAPWNVGDPDCITPMGPLPLARGDDDSFLDAMLEFAANDQCLDREHVFMTGFSMGAYFTNEVGCTRSDIRAISPQAGGSHDLSKCPVQRKPVLVVHFEDDSLVPYRCGTQTRDRWLQQSGCSASDPQVRNVQGGRCEYYRGCEPDGQVGMCSFQTPDGERTERSFGHAWAGGSKSGDAGGGAYAIPETASATELSWEFFKTYAW
ncbi:MAG TPA: PHB depolymerase family esterase [Polyangiales bacterium]|nr:PHB depolymerase family esterase [Polyangiales bacterium]